MKRTIITSVAVLGAWCALGVDFASAQFGTLGQPRRPAVSPYNMLGVNGNRGAGMSYYGLIRPQIDANRSIMDLQNAMGRMNPDGSIAGPLDQQNQTGTLGGLQTGHVSTYFNYGHYYPIAPPGGAGAGLGNTGGFGQGMGGMGGFNSGFGSPPGGGASNAPRTVIGSGGGVGFILR